MKVYVISSILSLGSFYLGYLLFLRKEKNFQFNRFYLLFCLFLGLAAPALSIDYGLELPETQKMPINDINTASEKVEPVEKGNVVSYQAETWGIYQIVFCIYLIVCGILLLRFGRNLTYILYRTKEWKGETETSGGLRILYSSEKGNPYSFFNYLFVHPEDLEEPDFLSSLIPHELTHSRELHTVDVILAELVCCCFWFNPFTWLFKTKIVENHEYLADSAVINSGIDVETYSQQIIYKGDQLTLPIISGFSFMKTKNRINMLNKEKSSKYLNVVKLGVAVGLMAIVFTASSFSTANKNSTPFVVIVDAGHGGKDVGPLNEKEVNFQVSQQLKALSSKGGIEIILVREEDEFITLKDRVEFASAQNADLFLSLHSNTSTDPSISGVEAYYSPENDFSTESLQFSKILISKQVEKVANRGEVKTANFVVLRDLTMPGVLLELGYLSNSAEASRLRDPEHQKRIANAILEGLKEIGSLKK